MFALFLLPAVFAQASKDPAPSAEESGNFALDAVFGYLNMAGTNKVSDFKPLTQHKRNQLYKKALVNPVWYFRGAVSAAQNQWLDKPHEWEQGGKGYGKRYADIMGQYAIQKTTTFGLESLLHEDNRYFGSQRTGFWPRTRYALSSGILARRDNGTRRFSLSLVGGYASAAFLSRLWQPPSANTLGDGAASFGISMGWNIGFSVVKEFLPDLLRPLTGKSGPPKTPPGQVSEHK